MEIEIAHISFAIVIEIRLETPYYVNRYRLSLWDIASVRRALFLHISKEMFDASPEIICE